MLIGCLPVLSGAAELPRAQLEAAVAEATHFPDRFEAEVWLMDMSQRLAVWVPDPTERLTILVTTHREATAQDVPPELVLALMETESGFDRFAVSTAGARGLMQVMPFWKEVFGEPEANLLRIETNIRFGCRILRRYLERENGDWPAALARYHGSVGERDYSLRVLRRLARSWKRQ